MGNLHSVTAVGNYGIVLFGAMLFHVAMNNEEGRPGEGAISPIVAFALEVTDSVVGIEPKLRQRTYVHTETVYRGQAPWSVGETAKIVLVQSS